VLMSQSPRRAIGRLTGTQAAIVLMAVVVTAIVGALAIRVAVGDDSEPSVDPYSAEIPVAVAPDTGAEGSTRLGVVEATAAFGLIGLWVLAGTVMTVRGRRGKPPKVRTAN
jgi:hypothetical protein